MGDERKERSEAQMIAALHQMEAGRPAKNVGREYRVSKHTCYTWKASTEA
jgi:putative transposase